MKRYALCEPENPNWCVPASLQTVLKSRGIEISQMEIARIFPEGIDGLKFGAEYLREFLKRFNLRCSFYNPHEKVEQYQDCDIFLRDAGGDILAGYNANCNNRENMRGQRPHLSVLLDFSFEFKLVRLADETLPLDLLIQNMNPEEHKSYGFYVVKDNQV